MRYSTPVDPSKSAVRALSWALSEETDCHIDSVEIAPRDEQEFTISILQGITRNHSVGGGVPASFLNEFAA